MNEPKRKQSLYFPEDMLMEIQAEANRQDRSLSWLVQQAWRIGRTEILRYPSVNDVLSGLVREETPPTEASGSEGEAFARGRFDKTA